MQPPADAAAVKVRAHVQLRELEMSRPEPALGSVGAECAGDTVVPPLPAVAAVAVDEADQTIVREGAEETETVAHT